MVILQAKLVILGKNKVGKTSIRKRYMGQGFNKSHLPTMGADFAIKDIDVGDDVLKLQIWDIAGQTSFHAIRKRFYSNTSGAFIVFDLTDLNSYQEIGNWIEELWKTIGTAKIPLVIVGNKYDLVDPETMPIKPENVHSYIAKLAGQSHMEKDMFTYIETSAKTGKNIEEAFETLAGHIVAGIKGNYIRELPNRKPEDKSDE